MIFYIATFLFVVCSLSTLTSVPEIPLISSSVHDNDDTENTNDDEHNEIHSDERHPLLSLPRNSSRSYKTTSKSDPSTADMYLKELKNQEGFVEIDLTTGASIPHDHIEKESEDILLQTMECSYQIVAASMTNEDTFTAGSMPANTFEAELRQKAKLVKLGI